jgi:hypothetical protein
MIHIEENESSGNFEITSFEIKSESEFKFYTKRAAGESTGVIEFKFDEKLLDFAEQLVLVWAKNHLFKVGNLVNQVIRSEYIDGNDIILKLHREIADLQKKLKEAE